MIMPMHIRAHCNAIRFENVYNCKNKQTLRPRVATRDGALFNYFSALEKKYTSDLCKNVLVELIKSNGSTYIWTKKENGQIKFHWN